MIFSKVTVFMTLAVTSLAVEQVRSQLVICGYYDELWSIKNRIKSYFVSSLLNKINNEQSRRRLFNQDCTILKANIENMDIKGNNFDEWKCFCETTEELEVSTGLRSYSKGKKRSMIAEINLAPGQCENAVSAVTVLSSTSGFELDEATMTVATAPGSFIVSQTIPYASFVSYVHSFITVLFLLYDTVFDKSRRIWWQCFLSTSSSTNWSENCIDGPWGISRFLHFGFGR